MNKEELSFEIKITLEDAKMFYKHYYRQHKLFLYEFLCVW